MTASETVPATREVADNRGTEAPNFLDSADPDAFRQLLHASPDAIDGLVEEAVGALGCVQKQGDAQPEFRRVAGYCEAMLRRLVAVDPETRTRPADQRSRRGGVTLDADEARAVRFAVLVGLQSFGEIERLINLAEVFAERLPNGMHPNHPTGDAETVSKFADALVYLEPSAEVAHG